MRPRPAIAALWLSMGSKNQSSAAQKGSSTRHSPQMTMTRLRRESPRAKAKSSEWLRLEKVSRRELLLIAIKFFRPAPGACGSVIVMGAWEKLRSMLAWHATCWVDIRQVHWEGV